MAEKPLGILSPEIEKLSERLQKEPNSKVFLNLAEEYYRAGMLDEALTVLTSGLKANPTYLSAKVLLGKVYFDQQKTKEAREIFEQILKINPDNLIVNKKLSHLYLNEKRFQEAEKCCNQILFFNAKDADALSLSQKIKEGREGAKKEMPPASVLEKPAGPATGAKMTESPLSAAPVITPAQPEPVREAFASEEPIRLEKPASPAPAHSPAVLSAKPVPETPPLQESVPAIPVPPPRQPAAAPMASNGKADERSSVNQIQQIGPEEAEGSVPSDQALNFADIMKEEEVKPPPRSSGTIAGAVPSENKIEKKEDVKDRLDTVALAELYLKQGHYEKGIDIFQKLLDQDPFNETLRQQLEDAKTMGKLLGVRDRSQKIEDEILHTVLPKESQKPETPAVPAFKASAPLNNAISPQKQIKIDKLKQWLELLQKRN